MEAIVRHVKEHARALHRAASAADPQALQRLRRLPGFRKASDGSIQAELLRRHCLAVLALELGFAGWPRLSAVLSDPEASDFGTLLHRPECLAHWNIWSAHYDEARQIRAQTGGTLLVYKNQYLVVEDHYLRTLGLDPEAPEWEAIGRDWARPADPQARQRLAGSLVKQRLAG